MLIQCLRYWPVIAILIGMYGLSSGWAAIFLYHAGIVGAVLASKRSFREILEGFKAGPAVGLFIAGLLAAPAVIFLLPPLVGMDSNEIKNTLRAGLENQGMAGWGFILFALYLGLIHPGLEEIGWRGLLFVDSKMIHLRDFMFASYHLLVMHYFFPYQWAFFAVCIVGLAVMGWIWRLLKMKYGGLAVPTCFHAGGDIGAMAGVWWLLA